MSEFIEYLHEVFELLGPLSARRMFDGYTLYYDKLPFGIVYDDTLYLKADRVSARFFEELELPRFTYEKQGKTINLPYFQAPDYILEDRAEAALWGRRAFEAALRAQAASKGKKRNRRVGGKA